MSHCSGKQSVTPHSLYPRNVIFTLLYPKSWVLRLLPLSLLRAGILSPQSLPTTGKLSKAAYEQHRREEQGMENTLLVWVVSHCLFYMLTLSKLKLPLGYWLYHHTSQCSELCVCPIIIQA